MKRDLKRDAIFNDAGVLDASLDRLNAWFDPICFVGARRISFDLDTDGNGIGCTHQRLIIWLGQGVTRQRRRGGHTAKLKGIAELQRPISSLCGIQILQGDRDLSI